MSHSILTSFRRTLLVLSCLAGLGACGYKGDLYMPPPPPPADSLTTPPTAGTPATPPSGSVNRAK